MASATSVINSVFLWNILILVWIISHLPTRKPARFIGTGAQEHFWTLPSDSPSAAEQLMHHRVCLPIYIYALSLHTHVTVGLPYPSSVYLLPSNNVLLSIPSPKGKCVKLNHHHPVVHQICGPVVIFLRLCFCQPQPNQIRPNDHDCRASSTEHRSVGVIGFSKLWHLKATLPTAHQSVFAVRFSFDFNHRKQWSQARGVYIACISLFHTGKVNCQPRTHSSPRSVSNWTDGSNLSRPYRGRCVALTLRPCEKTKEKARRRITLANGSNTNFF